MIAEVALSHDIDPGTINEVVTRERDICQNWSARANVLALTGRAYL